MINIKSHLDEIGSKNASPPTLEGDIFTSRKHNLDYFTPDGFTLRTGYMNKSDWYLLPIRECLDNAADFLWKNYSSSNKASITVNLNINDDLFHLKVKNSNEKNIPVFSNLDSIFDYSMRYGSKQDLHLISRGMLGDAMKQILSLGYVLLHVSNDGTSFTDRQWEHPLVVRHNNFESKIYLEVDKAAQLGRVKVIHPSQKIGNLDTELEVVLPVISEVRGILNGSYVQQFCRKYTIFTTNIEFEFNITDSTTSTKQNRNRHLHAGKIITFSLPALHSISKWTNSNSIHSYKPEEFLARIMNVHRKDRTSVYDVLLTFREGSQIKKTEDNRKSIAELLSNEDTEHQIEKLYYQLKGTANAAIELPLPHAYAKQRARIVTKRIAQIYDIDENKESSYKLVRGYYDDEIISYPYAVEILAAPFNNPIEKDTEVVVAVNYSVSPRENNLAANYKWLDRKGNLKWAKELHELLEKNGFQRYNGLVARLPSVVVINLITPRREPHGYDKSSLDTSPYADTIATAVSRVALGVQTFRAAGYRFQDAHDYTTARRHDINTKVSARRLLEKFLITERGLKVNTGG